jgi:hypothetical protein
MAAKDIGQETVQYVSNIYKYYVAYKMALEQQKTRDQAKQSLKANWRVAASHHFIAQASRSA